MGTEEGVFKIPIFHIPVAESVIVQWGIILFLAILSIILTRNLKKRPDKKQSVLELLYVTVENLVKENMGEGYMGFVPFIGALILYLISMNLVPLIGIKAPTEELSVTLAMACITFFVIQGYAIYKNGIGGYFKGYLHPMAFMLPMNIIERFMLVVSLSLRLFGNVAAGAVIMEIIYDSLGKASPILGVGIPVPFHFYFDLFDGLVQMLIFTLLTMVQIKIISSHD